MGPLHINIMMLSFKSFTNKEFLQENKEYTHVPHDNEQVRIEHTYEIKRHHPELLKHFPTQESLKSALDNSPLKEMSPEEHNRLGNSTNFSDLDSLQRFTNNYVRPRPVKEISDNYDNKVPMSPPITIKQNGRKWILSGNTRMNVMRIKGMPLMHKELDLD